MTQKRRDNFRRRNAGILVQNVLKECRCNGGVALTTFVQEINLRTEGLAGPSVFHVAAVTFAFHGIRSSMSRYKGRVSARAIERDFPHVVETVVPKGGLGKTLDAMHEFHKLHGIDAHTGKGRRDKNGRDYIRRCFANPGIAAKFASHVVRG